MKGFPPVYNSAARLYRTAVLHNVLQLIVLLFPILFYSCHHKISPVAVSRQEEAQEKQRPIHQADPTIFYHRGTYYLYGTNDTRADTGFVVYSSRDLRQWKFGGAVLTRGNAFGTRGFWAPQVWEQGGTFYMAYTANEKIAIASSNSPLGPFTQAVKEPLRADYGQIDPFVFRDDDGKVYLFHVRLDGGNHIYVAEMNPDLSGIKPGTYNPCISVTPGTWEQVAGARVAEGPTVIKRGGLYYLFYSANDFRNKDYAVGYAVSSSVHGPWKRYTGNPLISRKVLGFDGTGHGDVLKGRGGKLYYVFHTHNSAVAVGPRKTALVPLKVTKDSSGVDVFQLDKESFRYLTIPTR